MALDCSAVITRARALLFRLEDQAREAHGREGRPEVCAKSPRRSSASILCATAPRRPFCTAPRHSRRFEPERFEGKAILCTRCLHRFRPRRLRRRPDGVCTCRLVALRRSRGARPHDFTNNHPFARQTAPIIVAFAGSRARPLLPSPMGSTARRAGGHVVATARRDRAALDKRRSVAARQGQGSRR